MKTKILIILLFISSGLFAQTINQRVTFTKDVIFDQDAADSIAIKNQTGNKTLVWLYDDTLNIQCATCDYINFYPTSSSLSGGGGSVDTFILATRHYVDSSVSGLIAPIEITRAQAITHDAANGGDGDWIDGAFYRITNPLSPLSNVVLQALKDVSGNVRLMKIGVGYTSSQIQVDVGYDALANTIQYISLPDQNNYISNSSYTAFFTNDINVSNNVFKSCYLSFSGGSYYANNYVNGGSVVLVQSEINNVVLTGGSNISATGSIYTDSYITRSNLHSSTVTVTGDSKISNCTFNNITISGSGITLTNCTFTGNSESIAFPSGYTAVGKTFISGVLSTFENNLSMIDMAGAYNSTNSVLGTYGTLTLPSDQKWVGVWTLTKEWFVVQEIFNVSEWFPSTSFFVDADADGGVFGMTEYATANYLLSDALIVPKHPDHWSTWGGDGAVFYYKPSSGLSCEFIIERRNGTNWLTTYGGYFTYL